MTIVPASLGGQIFPSFLLQGGQSLDLGPTLNPGSSYLEILDFITSAKTLFPKRVRFIGTRGQDLYMSFWETNLIHSTHFTYKEVGVPAFSKVVWLLSSTAVSRTLRLESCVGPVLCLLLSTRQGRGYRQSSPLKPTLWCVGTQGFCFGHFHCTPKSAQAFVCIPWAAASC